MRGLTPTDCLRYINRNLGAALQTIELSEDEIMRIVFQESLPTFSKYFPWKWKATVNCNKDKVPGTRTKFFIQEKGLDKVKILGVGRVWIDNISYYGNSQITLNTNPFSYQLYSDAISATTTPITFLFEPPNIIEIHPYIESLGDCLVEINAVHPDHMATIGLDMREHFLRLAYLDVLVSLLPLRKRFDSISTTYGSISLFLDAVDSSVQDRKDLLDLFQENILKDSDARKIWIA